MHSLRNIILHSVSILLLFVLVTGVVSCRENRVDRVVIVTEMGEIEAEVYPDRAPVTASNFLALVEQGVYSNSSFYRVVRMDNQPEHNVRIEVIQGGLFEDSLVAQFRPILHESTQFTGIRHTDGALSMARNEPGTASTEFFICVGDQPSLDFGGGRNPDGAGFAAFGRVVRGMEVVRAIQERPDKGQYLESPVVIHEIKVIFKPAT